MKVKIHRRNKDVDIPRHQTPGSVGFDLSPSVTTTINPKEIVLLPTGLVFEIPPGYMLAIVPRSSTARKKGLMMPNGIGVIDQDYCGPEDEIKILVYNFTDQPVTVEKGERIVQGIFVRVDRTEWEEVEMVDTRTRGGFGSTG